MEFCHFMKVKKCNLAQSIMYEIALYIKTIKKVFIKRGAVQ